MTVTALETHFAGCRFRSRLEARWAVFFTVLGMKWHYEPQGYDADGPYLPDFYLPGRWAWAEVKGALDDTTLDKAVAFARHDQRPVIVLDDIPAEGLRGPHHVMLGWNRAGQFSAEWFTWITRGSDWHIAEEPHGFPRLIGDEDRVPDELAARRPSAVDNDPAVAHAYRVARQARFEHGDIPDVPRPRRAHR